MGVEGPTDDPEINAQRDRQIRNMLTTLLLSQGTPMLLAGDEFGRTQNGNNNAYCQDSEISWVNWALEEKGESLIAFVKQLTKLRHNFAILRRNRFLTGAYNEELGVKDVTWINASGAEMKDSQWRDAGMRCFGMLIDGRAQPTGIKKRGDDATMLLVFNGAGDGVNFTLPECPGGSAWTLLIDTNQTTVEPADFKSGKVYIATGRSALVFSLKPEVE
jgi:glycogen operon protein